MTGVVAQLRQPQKWTRTIPSAQALIFALCSGVFNSVFFWENTFGLHTPIHNVAFLLSLFAISFGRLRIGPMLLGALTLYGTAVVGLQFVGQDPVVLNRVSFVILTAIIVYSWDLRRFLLYRRWMTILCVALVIGAVLGELYSLAGRAPVEVFMNGDGSVISRYGTTLATTTYGGAIRASGIYDEAGTFVFVIWVTVLLRILTGKNDGYVLFLVIGGFCTFSLIHTVLAALYFIRYFRTVGTSGRLAAALLSAGLLAWVLMPADLSTYFERFRVEHGRLAGDNRTQQIESFFRHINVRVFFLGDPAVVTGTSDFDYSSNPFNPIVNNGIIVSLPFYLLSLWLLYVAVLGRYKLEALVLFLLLMQRPYLFSFGYCYLILGVVAVLVLAQRRRTAAEPPPVLLAKELR